MRPYTLYICLLAGTLAGSARADVTYEWRQGVDHGFGTYNSAKRVMIGSSAPDSRNMADQFGADLATDGRQRLETLLRFEDIFGTGPGQIPLGSVIESAAIEVVVINSGHVPRLRKMLTSWDENSLTHNNALLNGNTTPGIQGDGVEASTSFVSVPDGLLGTRTFDVTSTLQDWSDGNTNWGWVVQATGTNAWGSTGITAAPINQRPLLRVTFTPEPSSLALLGLFGCGLTFRRRRKAT